MNRNLRIKILLNGVLFSVLSLLSAFSQARYSEQITAWTDRHYYLAGENILLSLSCRDACSLKPSGISSVAFVELIDGNGRVWVRRKLPLKKGRAAGIIPIPRDAGSREYVLRSYTSWMRNAGHGAFHYSPVLILHPDKPYAASGVKGSFSAPGKFIPQEEAIPLKISELKDRYGPRDTLSFQISSQETGTGQMRSELTVSVVRSGTLLPGPVSPGISRAASPSGQPDSLLLLPDPKGLSLSGVVEFRSTGIAAAGTELLLTTVGNPAEVYHTVSGPDGNFRFELGQLTGLQDLVIQLPENGDGKVISLFPQFSGDPLPPDAVPRLFHEDLEPVYRHMLLNMQIKQVYWQPVQPDPGPAGPLPFYGEPDQLVILDEYIDLPVMEEVLRELTSRVYLEREKEGFRARILDLNTNRIIGDHPWFFVDGVPFFDTRQLLDLDPSGLERIALKSRKYFSGNLVMDGIVDIRTKTGDAGMLELPRPAVRHYYRGFEREWTNEAFSSPGKHIPDYRTTVLFLPHLEHIQGSVLPVEVILPDAAGDYDIVIRGISGNGEPVSCHTTLKVGQ